MSEHAVAQQQNTNTSKRILANAVNFQRQAVNHDEPTALPELKLDTLSGDFAEPRLGFDFSGVPAFTGMARQARPLLQTKPMIQRSPKDESSGSVPCLSCSDAESTQTSASDESTVETGVPAHEAAPTAAPTEPITEQAVPGETPASGLIVEDSATELGPGQMRRSELLSQLRTEVCRTVETAIAGTGRSTEDCPYLDHWFGYYSRQDSAHIERAIRGYAPETSSATTARGYISAVTQRARQSAETWARTGEITGVPEGMPIGLPGTGLMGSLVSGIGSIFFKARNGGARAADDPQAIQRKLGEGQPLDSGVRSRMESTFGMNFSHVRTHTDNTASGLSNRFNARAFTVGEHVAFGSGEYQPGTIIGDALIAHELAHVVQQGNTSASIVPMETGNAGYNALEKDADHSALHAVVAVWQKAVGTASNLTREIMPRLRSGITLQRCSATTCPTTINKNTTLTRDCTNGIVVEADNIILDGGGHTLTGSAPTVPPATPRERQNDFSEGITLRGRSNVTVNNCRVTNFGMGFRVASSNDNTFTNNRADGNARDGFDLNSSHRNRFINNSASNNDLNGIELDGSTENTFIRNTVNNNRDGFDIDDDPNAPRNIFRLNTANENTRDGFRIRSDANILTGNIANNNTNDGFHLEGDGPGNILTENTANNNRDGFNLQMPGNALMQNTANANQRDGLRVRSDSNTFTWNTANNNSSQDFDLRSSDGNTCENNTFTNPRVRGQCPPQFP